MIMKKFVAIALLMFIGTSAFSQTVSFTSPNAQSQRMLDSVKYILPEFTAGMVIFKNGEQSNGAININTIDQKIHFIDPKGEILVITNNDDVSRVLPKDVHSLTVDTVMLNCMRQLETSLWVR